jgi:hypothetical protein
MLGVFDSFCLFFYMQYRWICCTTESDGINELELEEQRETDLLLVILCKLQHYVSILLEFEYTFFCGGEWLCDSFFLLFLSQVEPCRQPFLINLLGKNWILNLYYVWTCHRFLINDHLSDGNLIALFLSWTCARLDLRNNIKNNIFNLITPVAYTLGLCQTCCFSYSSK